jgi:alkanesulfonate monooxygenase SsuD/methylene tetrahydromethanopterin reductase-like flavin-dependent oxidoreductase (luciferase family)
MAGMRPFRFLATAGGYPGFAELTSLARKAEAAGCAAFVLPDHLIGQHAPVPVLAAVAAVTERLRVGTFVLNVCLRHPAVLAQDLATLDVLSGRRLEIGLGAGWNKPNTTPPASRAPKRAAAPTRKFTDLRERFGISSFLIDDLGHDGTGSRRTRRTVKPPAPPAVRARTPAHAP